MNSAHFGKNIARLRKNLGLTQLNLAKMLNISDKAVSKWENGGGYPEITLLPQLSEILGVSVDSLLKSNTVGIAVAGTITADIINEIDKYPKKGTLSNVISTHYKTGGCVPRVATEISKIDRDLYVLPIGKVGNDDNGRMILSKLKNHGIDVSRITTDHTLPTSTSYILHEASTDSKTYFHSDGANASLCPEDICVNELDCKIFHIGHITLLKTLDAEDEQYGTKMARLLSLVSDKGIKTSFTLSCDNPNLFTDKLTPLFRYVDYPILRYDDCRSIVGINPTNDDGSINMENVRTALEKFIDMGVRSKVILDGDTASFIMNTKKKLTMTADIKLPEAEYEKSQDEVFVAACLYALYKGYDDKKILNFALGAAALYLMSHNHSGALRSKTEIENFEKKFPRKKL